MNFDLKSKRESTTIAKGSFKKILNKIDKISERKNFHLKIYIQNDFDQENIIDKYKIVEKIDDSTFAELFFVKEYKTGKTLCLKKIKSDKDIMDQSMMEIFILNYLSKSTNPYKEFTVTLHDFFYLNVS